MFSLTINHDLQDSRGRGGAISLIPLYDFHLLHRHVDISQAITTGSSPLRIASNWTRDWNLSKRKPLTSKPRALKKNLKRNVNFFFLFIVGYVDKSIRFFIFPSMLKLANITSVHKKN